MMKSKYPCDNFVNNRKTAMRNMHSIKPTPFLVPRLQKTIIILSEDFILDQIIFHKKKSIHITYCKKLLGSEIYITNDMIVLTLPSGLG